MSARVFMAFPRKERTPIGETFELQSKAQSACQRCISCGPSAKDEGVVMGGEFVCIDCALAKPWWVIARGRAIELHTTRDGARKGAAACRRRGHLIFARTFNARSKLEDVHVPPIAGKCRL